eukprot:CAMPEP_0197640156 /NCGR_PEP_ID=MMETSP1338-20131121/14541_1 /TAXON_ID=43686 ORGANISM="Pelagodinium beii, Strain RCC1491" /NCGR_SAMPLE_ID=MMETSP1338 /ASSEMBLY_ACC=CAM_ASM_000754 /LENGTH=375 /DNA_ID=CAMNT_0043212975 /DNA_START=39 /DNA_END=1163 /DNA_ORIENTATION=-
MGAPGAFDASAIQRQRTQETGWRNASGELIRGGVPRSSVPNVSPAAPPPVKLLKGAYQQPAGNLPSFHPTIEKRPRRTVQRPANLRDRVALTKRLEDPLKEECLDRLAGIASRAPPVRRPSWTEEAVIEVVESDDDDVINLNRDLKDLLGEDDDELFELEEDGAKDQLRTASVPQIKAERPPEVEEEANLAEMVSQNQELAAAAGLTTEFPYTWRSGDERDDEQPASQEGSLSPRYHPEADTFRELYDHADLGLSLTALPGAAAHWHYNPQIQMKGTLGSAHEESSKKPKPKPEQTQPVPEQTEMQPVQTLPEKPLPTVQSTLSSPVNVVSLDTMSDARQAVVSAKAQLGRAADRGSSSLLRTSLRVMMQAQAPS